jgi:hypothetical protein
MTHSSSDAVNNANNSNEVSSQENSKAVETEIAYNQINESMNSISNEDEINLNSFTNPLALVNMDVNELIDDNNNTSPRKSTNNNEVKFSMKNADTIPKKINKTSANLISNLNNSINSNPNNLNALNDKPFDLFTSN